MQDPQPTILSLDVGDVLLGRYRLERIIGQGGMGAVWLATDFTLDHHVAIKVLPAVLSRDKRAVARLKEEARRNLALTHPHIVRLHTFEQDPARGDAAFLVMQYIEGHTLNDLLADHPGGLPLEQVGPWAEQIAAAIDFAHAKGILHRDIKPGNIIIEASTGHAYLMDFGIAREARDTLTRVTGQQDSSGTLPYMSPQQLMGKNHRSNDIYSLAATLYEVLSGDPPFTTGDIAYQIRQVAPEPLRHVPQALSAALLAGLAKVSEGRPGSCQAMLTREPLAAPSAPPPSAGRAHLSRKIVELAPGVPAEFVYIDAPAVSPQGFLMGSPSSERDRSDNEVQHRVKLTRGYWLQTTEVTQGQWESVMGSNRSHFKNGANHPVEQVNWDDCQAFIGQLREAGLMARLPTEAEWEFACRAGTTTPFHTGNTISTDQANYDGNYTYGDGRKGVYRKRTTPVGTFPANAWGLHDMHGNVWEWCQDWYGAYPSVSVTDPSGPQPGSDRVLRGGSWVCYPRLLRSAYRRNVPSSYRYFSVGFRLTLDSE